ncbi:MAG TPA: tRNA lysidine(34) synthetase TilS [Bacteriovoracaceae bacterium]|nr:tRNA lysidine(34) synthetase TilS [Bacteriovoracaceae bacterium]
MKKLSPFSYRALFFKHLHQFLTCVTSPQEKEGAHAVAVSGGLDSMTLLWVAKTLYNEGKIGPVRAIFVDHNTREGQKGEGAMVEKFCAQENIPFTVLRIEGLSTAEGNFEARARKIRRDLCFGNLRPGESLWAGHHLDDSYEWNFMQRNRSTNPKAMIGIPVRNRALIRPFLCVTRAQIERLATFEGIPHKEDPSNLDTRFDRNYVRHKVIPAVRKRYPKYLKFYATYSNFLAKSLKLSVLNRSGTSELFVYEKGAILVGKSFSEIQIQEVIHTYSNTDRGEIITPIQRLLKAIDNGKKGPFHFSGGMEAYYSHNVLMMYQQELKNHDALIAKTLAQLTVNQLQQLPAYKWIELKHAWTNLTQTPNALLNMPGLVLVLESDSICKTLNTSVFDSLFPEVSSVCKKKGLRFIPFQKCIDVWSMKKEKLPEKLRLLPLCNLSNLFAFQR